MVLKPTIIGLSAIRPLSPWERVRERAKRNNLKKTSSKKMATKNTHYPNHQKKNIKKTAAKYVSDDLFLPKSGTRRLKSDFPNISN